MIYSTLLFGCRIVTVPVVSTLCFLLFLWDWVINLQEEEADCIIRGGGVTGRERATATWSWSHGLSTQATRRRHAATRVTFHHVPCPRPRSSPLHQPFLSTPPLGTPNAASPKST